MNRKKLKKIRQTVFELRRSSPKAADIQAIAVQLGRHKVNRGKEPTWVNSEFPRLRPLSIPDHGGRDLSPGVKRSILNQLDDDLNAWDEFLSQQEEEFGGDDDNE